MSVTRWAKKASEEIYRYHEFLRPDGRGWLSFGETVESAVVTAAIKATGEDKSAEMVSNVAPYGETKVRYKLKGGVKGKLYAVAIKIVTSKGQKFEDGIEVQVT